MNSDKVFVFAGFFVFQKSISTDSIQLDMYEEAGKIHVEMEIPELDLDSLIVENYFTILQVSGFKKKKTKINATYLRAERIFGYFKKDIDMPFRVERISRINYKNGILEIILERF